MNTTARSTVSQEILQNDNVQNNLSVPGLVEKILSRNEGVLTATGAVQATTGKYTGRSPKDRFIVRDDVSENLVDWGEVNKPIDEASFQKLFDKVVNHLKNKDEVFSFKGFAGADEKYRLPVEVVNEYAWHNLFARQLFITPTKEELAAHEADRKSTRLNSSHVASSYA